MKAFSNQIHTSPQGLFPLASAGSRAGSTHNNTRNTHNMLKRVYNGDGNRDASSTVSRRSNSTAPQTAAIDMKEYMPSYSWIDHWLHVEDSRKFKEQVFMSTRGRQLQRRQYMMDLLGGSTSDSQSSDEEVDDRIVNGRLGVYLNATTDTVSDVDELTWLASHPEEVTVDPPVASVNWDSDSLIHPVELRIGSEVVPVRPLWISAFQPEGSATARLFESVVPLDASVLDNMTLDMSPFCTVTGLEFGEFADVTNGPWYNFFIGLLGEVAVDENEILWPNQILHRDRVLYNVRNADDIARFLANPNQEEVEKHLENLQRLADERKYKKGWCWHMLRARWGRQILDRYKIDTNSPPSTST